MNLKDNIDFPLRKVIALLNLYGLRTVWSCCGFDCKETNKDHVIGIPQIWMELNSKAFDKLMILLDYEIFGVSNEWTCMIRKLGYQKPMVMMFCNYLDKNANNGLWTNGQSPYYHERMNLAIKHLEDRLMMFKDDFVNKVILKDRNEEMKKLLSGWNISPCEDWIINKKDILSNKKEKIQISAISFIQEKEKQVVLN